MKFYHWTHYKTWLKIQKCGYLKSGTYFAPIPWLWKHCSYGTVLLEIEYTPKKEDFGKEHNYGFDPPPGQHCIQFNIFKDMPFGEFKIKRVDIKKLEHLKNKTIQLY